LGQYSVSPHPALSPGGEGRVRRGEPQEILSCYILWLKIMFSDRLKRSIEENRDDVLFQHYLIIRDCILAMIDEMEAYGDVMPSDYWQEELAGFDYLFDASPLIIARLREHCHHITGIRSYEYRNHHLHRKKLFAHKLALLQAEDKKGLFVPESPLLGGFGYRINGCLVNIDTLKFYECLLALDRVNLLDQFSGKHEVQPSVMEIGAGWGGFAYQFKTLFPDVTYVIVDLPHVLLFSSVYLKALFPEASMLVYRGNTQNRVEKPGCIFMSVGGQDILNPAMPVYGDKPAEHVFANAHIYDFIFLPHYLLPQFDINNLRLAVNIASFQEMTTGQVDGYINRLVQLRCSNIYSMNRNRSRHNTQLTSVGMILDKYYECNEIKVLDEIYLDFPDPEKSRNVMASLKNRIHRWEKRKKTHKKEPYQYRHIAGMLKQGMG